MHKSKKGTQILVLLLAAACGARCALAQHLTPFTPSGWSGKVYVANGPGTHSDSTPLSAADTLYIGWAVINDGSAATTVPFYTALYVDGALQQSWHMDQPLAPGLFVYVADYSIGPLPPGAHTLKIQTDTTGTIAESGADKEYSKTITVSGGPGCRTDATTLCLNAGRFKAQASWRTPQGATGMGMAVLLTGDTGYFWFFSRSNLELILKVLDGRASNRHFWVFYGALSDVEYTLIVTDTQTGLVRTYSNPQGRLASVADTSAFPAAPAAAAVREKPPTTPMPLEVSPQAYGHGPERVAEVAAGGTGCAAGSTALCLNAQRFQVAVAWQLPSGASGVGSAVALSGDTGYFWFFNSANVEVVVKILDATSLNGSYWVFYGALSDVNYTITITDTVTGIVQTYTNPQGRLASLADTSAFVPPIETSSQLISAARGGTVSLAGGSYMTFSPGALAQDRLVRLSRFGSLHSQPPSGIIVSVGPTLVLSLAPPPSAAAGGSVASGPVGQEATPGASDVQGVINLGPDQPPEVAGSAPMTNLVDLSGGEHFVGIPGMLDSTQGTATFAVPMSVVQGVQQVRVSLAQLRPAIEQAPLPNPGAKTWTGSGWIDGTPGFDPTKKTLVLVHGMNSQVEGAFGDCNDGGGFAAGKIQRAGGYEQVVGFDYDWTQGIETSGGQLAAFLDSLKSAGLTQVDIEAHSEGVPVTLAAACQGGTGANHIAIDHIAMLGGPINGTPAAKVGAVLQAGAGTAVNPLETVFLNVSGSYAPPAADLQGLLKGPFAYDLRPDSAALAYIRGCVAAKMADGSSNLGRTTLIAAAGTDFENKFDMGALGSVIKGLFGSEPFDGIVGLYSALGVGSGLNITRLPPYALSHTRLECDANVVHDVAAAVAGSGSCSYSLDAASQPFPSSGGSGSVKVIAPSSCAWSAVTNASWITITSVTSPSGNGRVNFSVDANQGTSQRIGTMTIAGLTFTVTEDGSSPSGDFAGSWSGTYTLSHGGVCNWTWGGTMMLTVSVNGGSVSGTAYMDGVQDRNLSTCEVDGSESVSGTLTGSVSGSQLQASIAGTGSVTGATVTVPFTANVSGNQMTGTFGGGDTGTFSLTRQ